VLLTYEKPVALDNLLGDCMWWWLSVELWCSGCVLLFL